MGAKAGSVQQDILSVQVIALVTLSFALGCSEFVVVGILPDIAGSLAVELTLVGNLVGVFAGVYAVCTPVLTLATANVPKYRLLMVLCVVFVAGNVGTALAPTYGVLLAARVVSASVSGAACTVSMTFVADIAAPEARPKVIAIIFAGFSVASVAGVPVGTAIAHAAGWHAAFWVISALTALVTAVLAKTLPRGGASRDARDGMAAGAPATREGRAAGLALRFMLSQLAVLRDRRTVLNALQIMFSMAGLYVYYTYLNPLLVQVIGLPEAALPLALAAYGVMAVLSNLSAGVVADRWGQRALPVVYATLAALLAVLPFASAAGPAVGIAACLALGYVTALHNSQVQVLFMEVAEADFPQALNFASSLNPTFYNIGITLGSLLSGAALAHVGSYAWLGPVGAVLAALACVLAVTLVRVLAQKGEGAHERNQQNVEHEGDSLSIGHDRA